MLWLISFSVNLYNKGIILNRCKAFIETMKIQFIPKNCSEIKVCNLTHKFTTKEIVDSKIKMSSAR